MVFTNCATSTVQVQYKELRYGWPVHGALSRVLTNSVQRELRYTYNYDINAFTVLAITHMKQFSAIVRRELSFITKKISGHITAVKFMEI